MAGLPLLLGLLACVHLAFFQPPVLILTELCYYPLDSNLIGQKLKEMNFNVEIMEERDICDNDQLFYQVSANSRLMIGSFKPEICSTVHFLRMFQNRSMVSWNCPLVSKTVGLGETRLSPPISAISRGFARVVGEMKWKSVAIISSVQGWWPSLTQAVDTGLRELGIIPRHLFRFDNSSSLRRIERKLSLLRKVPCHVVLLCLPADDFGKMVLKSLEALELQALSTVAVFMDVSNLPDWLHFFQNVTAPQVSSNVSSDNIINAHTKRNALIFTQNSTFSLSFETLIVQRLQSTYTPTDSSLSFVLGDFSSDDQLRPLMVLTCNTSDLFFIEKFKTNLDEWSVKHIQTEECEDCTSSIDKVLSVFIILGGSCLFVSLILGVVILARNQLLKKRVSKGPYKVLLTATDFVFPQIADSRRVSITVGIIYDRPIDVVCIGMGNC